MLAEIFVLIVSIVTFTRTIATSTMRNWDEAWYAEISKNMASGRWGYLQPFWNGQYYFDHAPLYFWLATPIFKIFGPGLWQTRVVSAIAAIFACLLIFLIAKKLSNKIAGLASFLIFLTFGGIIIRFSHGNLDSLLLCFFLASFHFYLNSEKQKYYVILSGIFIGLGLLIKSWGIGLFPIALIFLYSLTKNKKLPKNLLLLVIPAIIFSCWWYALGFSKFGPNFLNWYLFNPSEGRLSSPFTNLSLDYINFAIRDIGFWLIIPICYLISNYNKLKELNKNIIIPFLTLSLFFIFVLNFLSTKSAWYLIPALALISIVIGYMFSKLYSQSPKLAILLFALIFIIQVLNIIRIENITPDRSKVGVLLGQKAKEVIPNGNTIILNDEDFTTFLFYSDQAAIYTLENKNPLKNEWWILNSKTLPDFIKSHQNVWIVTPKPNSLPIEVKKDQIKYLEDGYSFIQL